MARAGAFLHIIAYQDIFKVIFAEFIFFSNQSGGEHLDNPLRFCRIKALCHGFH